MCKVVTKALWKEIKLSGKVSNDSIFDQVPGGQRRKVMKRVVLWS